MGSLYCLDTSALIWFLRGKASSVQLIEKISEEGVPACSALSVYEVEVGMKKGEEKGTQKFLNTLRIIPVDADIARLAAEYGREYARMGRTLNPVDTLIAATCLVHDLVLVTYDLKGFPMPELKLHSAALLRPPSS